jgi:hypothetical protein
VNIKVALAWLAAEDWPAWQEADPSLSLYEEWLVKVEAKYREAHQRGMQFELVWLAPHQFVAWCKAKGLDPGESARAEYASAALARRPKQV